jgi:hypothetical protein
VSEVRDIVLWGASQVGKTTALAAFLSHRPPSWLDTSAEESQKTLVDLGEIWNMLQRNQLPPPNAIPLHYEVRSHKGSILRFRDMRGGDAETFAGEQREANLQALREAAGVMLFVSWPGDGRTEGVIAARNALRQLGRQARALVLVLTKVEAYLSFYQLASFRIKDPLEVARELPLSAPFVDLLRELPPAAIFPITVYGYSEEGHPAHYLDEFGQLVPWNIRPHFVELPFNHVVEGLTT